MVSTVWIEYYGATMIGTLLLTFADLHTVTQRVLSSGRMTMEEMR